MGARSFSLSISVSAVNTKITSDQVRVEDVYRRGAGLEQTWRHISMSSILNQIDNIL